MISTAQTKSANGWSFGLFNAQMLLSTNGRRITIRLIPPG